MVTLVVEIDMGEYGGGRYVGTLEAGRLLNEVKKIVLYHNIDSIPRILKDSNGLPCGRVKLIDDGNGLFGYGDGDNG